MQYNFFFTRKMFSGLQEVKKNLEMEMKVILSKKENKKKKKKDDAVCERG